MFSIRVSKELSTKKCLLRIFNMRRGNSQPERSASSASSSRRVLQGENSAASALTMSESVNLPRPSSSRNRISNSSISAANAASPLFPPIQLEMQKSNEKTSATSDSSSSTTVSNDLLGKLHNFYKQGQFTDVEIHISGKVVRSHRVVLAAASDFFRAMFSHNMSESNEGIVKLHDLDEAAVQTLVDFAYVPELNPPLSVENMQPLLYAASILQFGKVLSLCSEFIAANLDPHHALPLLPLAQHFGLSQLLAALHAYIARTFHDTILCGASVFDSATISDDLMLMTANDLIAVFTDKELVVRNESTLLEVLLKWANCDENDESPSALEKASRLEEAQRVFLKGIKVAYLPVETIYRLLRTEPITSNANGEVRNKLEDALMCHLSGDDDRQLSSTLGVTRTTELRTPRRCCSGALVCVGGRQASSEPFRSAELYDWTHDQWLKIPDMNARRRHVGVAVCSRQNRLGLYAVGGHDGSRHLDSVEVLPLEPGGRWQMVASLHTLRRGLAVTTVHVDSSTNLLFAIGGLDDQSCFPHVEIYDPEIDAWSFGPAMSQSRGGVACAAITTRIYAVGGNDGSFSVDSGEVLDPVAGRWVPIARMRHRRAGAGLSVLNGCLWVAGGFDENLPSNAVEFYDPRSGVWLKGPMMLTPRGGVGLATMGNYLFAVGGHDGHEYLPSVECFDPRMFVTPSGNSSSPVADAGAAYASNSSSSNVTPPSSSLNSVGWEYVARLCNGRAGAGLVHVPNIVPSFDMPIISSNTPNSARSVADCV